MQRIKVDVAVIGGGPAGMAAAVVAFQLLPDHIALLEWRG